MSETRRRFLSLTAAGAAAAGWPGWARAQQYPAQDVHFICGYPPGSGADVIVRFVAEKIRPLLGSRTIIVENRVGAGGNIAMAHVARSKPDGYTVFIHGGNAVAASMSLLKSPPVDVAKTLRVAATINKQPFMCLVNANSPYKTLADLTKAMKEKGPKASYATSAPDGTVMGELYKAATGVQAVEVVYRTASDSLNDQLNGNVDYSMHNPVYAVSQHVEGRMRVLGVSSGQRLEAFPDWPTMAEQGVPMDLTGWWAALVPAGTPKPVVDQINGWFKEIVATPDAKKFLNGLGGDAYIDTADNAQALFLKEIDNWREYVRLAKITPQG